MADAVSSGSAHRGCEAAWIGEVLDFWFGELTRQQWFMKSDDTDRAIATRFLGLHENLSQVPPQTVRTSREALAAVIVLDQFPRNLFRGDSRAFASDSVALRLARLAVDAGLDTGLDTNGRLFLYLPFEHSEDAEDQRRSVDLISALGDPEYTRYAIAHRVIIDRFGRFPHRNVVLGRSSTPEEIAFLQGPDSSF